MCDKTVIAIDGGAGTGKSTLAKKLAERLGFFYMETGAMYRSVTLYAIEKSFFEADNESLEEKITVALPHIEIDFEVCNPTQKQHFFLNGNDVTEKIHSSAVSEKVAVIAKIKAVRDFLLGVQRKISEGQNIVMDGRDVGTVVFPNAKHKFFITAALEIRAERRHKQLLTKGEKIDFETVLQSIKKRDEQDINRKIAPLKKAENALEIDNSINPIEKTVEKMYQTTKKK